MPPADSDRNPELDPASVHDGRDSSTVPVRPLGYVEPRPVVRWIGDRSLALGNARAAESPTVGFDAVLSLTESERPLTTHHRPLIDGPETEWPAFAAAVDCARRLHRRDGSLLVHCTAGISRSAVVIATTIAAEEGRSFREALQTVQAARPHAIPHPALWELAVIYLSARA